MRPGSKWLNINVVHVLYSRKFSSLRKKLILLDELLQFFGVCVGDLPEQINSSTLASHLRSLQISSRDTEIQKSYDQASIETFTAKGSQSAQQLRQPQYPKTQVPANEASVSALTKDNQRNTSGTIGAFDDQVIIYKVRIVFQNEE